MDKEIAIPFKQGNLTKEELLKLYEAILLPRMIEEKMLSQLRLGKISKWFSSFGQEAISVGITEAMESDEFMLSSCTINARPVFFTLWNIVL